VPFSPYTPAKPVEVVPCIPAPDEDWPCIPVPDEDSPLTPELTALTPLTPIPSWESPTSPPEAPIPLAVPFRPYTPVKPVEVCSSKAKFEPQVMDVGVDVLLGAPSTTSPSVPAWAGVARTRVSAPSSFNQIAAALREDVEQFVP